jgi:hypothetical protein
MDDKAVKARAAGPPLRRIVVGLAALAVLLGAVVVVLVAGSAHRPSAGTRGHLPEARSGVVPISDTSLTPRGWAPVPYFGAQVSVPARWFVETDGGSECGGVSGMIFVGQLPRMKLFTAMGCRLARSVVVLTKIPSRWAQSATANQPNGVLNGFRVRTWRRSGTDVLIVPSLGIQVTARGPMAGRVLATLTHSPLSSALARGPGRPILASWRWHRFGGITFAAPGAWRVERYNWWGGCPYGIAARTVGLSTAAVLSVPSCPPMLPTAGFEAARPGIVIGAGRYATVWPSKPRYVTCLDLHGLRACVSAHGFAGGLLTLAVNVPGQTRPVIVEIGLAGSGAVARAIIESIGARSHPRP